MRPDLDDSEGQNEFPQIKRIVGSECQAYSGRVGIAQSEL